MSKYLKRVGSIKQKYQFEMIIHEVSINLVNPPSAISFQWKRGSKRIEAKTRVTLDSQGNAKVTDHITLLATLYFDSKKQRFQDKNAYINVIAIYEKAGGSKGKAGMSTTLKLVGMGKINMSLYAKPPVFTEEQTSTFPLTELDLPLQKCADSKGRLKVGIMSKLLNFDNNSPSRTESRSKAHLSTIRSIDSFSEDQDSCDDSGPNQSSNMLSSLVERIKSEKFAKGPPRPFSPTSSNQERKFSTSARSAGLIPARSNSPQLSTEEKRHHKDLEAYLKSTSSSASQLDLQQAGQFKDLIEKLKRRNDQLYSQNQELAEIREKLYIEKDKISMKMSTINRQNSKQKLTISDLQKQLRDTQFFLQEVTKEKEDLMGIVQDRDQQLREMSTKLKELSSQVEDENGTQTLIDDMKIRYEKLEQELMKEVKKCHLMEKQSDMLKLEIDKQKGQNNDLSEHIKNLSGALKKYELAYNTLQSKIKTKKTKEKPAGPSELTIQIMERIVEKVGDIRRLREDAKMLIRQQKEELAMYLETAKGELDKLEALKYSGKDKQIQVDIRRFSFGYEEQQDDTAQKQIKQLLATVAGMEKERAFLEMEVVEYKMKYAEALNTNTDLEKLNLQLLQEQSTKR